MLCSPLPDWTHVLEDEERWSERSTERRWDNEEGGAAGWGWVMDDEWGFAHAHAQRGGGDPAPRRSSLDALPNFSPPGLVTFSAVTGNVMTTAPIYRTAPQWFITHIYTSVYNLSRCCKPLRMLFNETLHTAVLLFLKHADITLSHMLRLQTDPFQTSVFTLGCYRQLVLINLFWWEN